MMQKSTNKISLADIRSLTIFTLLFVNTFSLSASKITVSTDIGFSPSNSTSFLQFALSETTEDTIIIDYVGSDWNTGPLQVQRNNITIIFEKDVVLKALPNVFDLFESLIRITDQNNIKIIGYGATFIMNKEEYITLNDSEFRHGIRLGSAINIVIEGLEIRDTGGDGILISKSFQPNSIQNFCENIVIRNCSFINNYRQGMSITSVKNAQILNCAFSETKGTLPEAGIDIEPDEPTERIENLLIKNCRIFNNYGNAIQVALSFMDDSSPDVSITIEDTYMANNHDPSNVYAYAEIAATDNDSNGVDGLVTFNNCYVASSEWSAVYIAKTVESYDLEFNNCVFKNVSNDPIDFNNPIFFEVTDYDNQVPRFGGTDFNNCSIIYDADIPFFDLYEFPNTSDGLGDVSGHFFIVNPNQVNYNIGTNSENVNITFEYFPSCPTNEISLTANNLDYLESDSVIIFEAQRTGIPLIPLAVDLEYSGTVNEALDIGLYKKFVLFPYNISVLNDTIEILSDDETEPSEFLNLSIVDTDCIIPAADSILNFSINDLITQTGPEYMLTDGSIEIFPNPT